MEAAKRRGTRQVGTTLRAGLGDIDEVDMLGSPGAPILLDLHPTEWARAIVIDGEIRISHGGNLGLDPVIGHVAQARFRIARGTNRRLQAPAAPSMTAAMASSRVVSSPAMASMEAMRRVTVAAIASSTVPSA